MVTAKRDLQLFNGDIISVGMNFRTLQLMAKYPGGMNKLKRNMEAMADADPDSDEYTDQVNTALDAFAYMLYALVRSSGVECTPETCAMMLGIEDFPAIQEIFEEFNRMAAKMMPGKPMPRGKAKK
jgi:hypothetical protein